MHKTASRLILLFLIVSAVSARKAWLRLDYREQRDYPYFLAYDSKCVIDEGESKSEIRTRITCKLLGIPEENGSRINFLVDSTRVRSELFDSSQQQSLIRKLNGSKLGLALIAGCPVVDTLSSFSVSELSEWDLVIQFAKLLPDIPNRPVRKGYTWERNAVHPINTSLGKIPCEVYRLYEVDSLSNRGKRAHISWHFRYAAADLAVDTSNILKRVPVSGKGKGSAVFDVQNEKLLLAKITFATPVAESGDVKITWYERTIFAYEPERADRPEKPTAD
jgi:hypothetical protein